MSALRPFIQNLGLWTAGLGFFFLIVGATGPGTQGVGILHKLPALLGFSLALAAFPAGVAASGPLLAERRGRGRRLGVLAGASLALSLAMGLNATIWAPNSLASSGFVFESCDPSATTHRTSRTLRMQGAEALATAQAAGIGQVADWQSVNTIAWEAERRLAHSSLPFLLTWVGVFAGFWPARIARRDLRLIMLWALGLFLVVSLYLASENSYELVVLRAAGPVFFAAWFLVFVPASLCGMLVWVTALELLGSERPQEWAP